MDLFQIWYFSVLKVLCKKVPFLQFPFLFIFYLFISRVCLFTSWSIVIAPLKTVYYLKSPASFWCHFTVGNITLFFECQVILLCILDREML